MVRAISRARSLARTAPSRHSIRRKDGPVAPQNST
ncbi:hypothetical protein [uncultured Tateyamaria sp.]